MLGSQIISPPPFSCNLNLHKYAFKKPASSLLVSSSSSFSVSFSSSLPKTSLRCAILGAGFAGLSVAWHLLQNSCKELQLSIDLYDEIGIGGGASGVAGGLLHPYSPKVKLLWRGAECWRETLKLLQVAEDTEYCKFSGAEEEEVFQNSIVRRRGILRPATSSKNLQMMTDNAQNYLVSCEIKSLNKDAAGDLVPGLRAPLNMAFYMPEAISVHSQGYLEALYLACKNVVTDMSARGFARREFNFHKRVIDNLLEFAGEYNAVIVCLGARTAFLPELSGILPLRTCRGVVAHLQLADTIRETYPEHSPSILSDAWVSVQGPRALHVGSTWEWNSTNYYRDVPITEASKALEELLPKASAVYPSIRTWEVAGAVAGLRAMPPLTPQGSLPLLGSVDNILGGNYSCKYWLFAGLGSRGLLYHAWLGKLLAQAVVSCNEEVLPSELTSWKQKLKQ
ncbi:hypothetical protein M9H77_27852 [Catharanthus roseus]|uniref:Uncharacterized protein n=1 Tax=Catharanthus roseus TaxID=4058 RepID=A0ACC0AEK0_CATRO|nr:hypothetical protein M9H77_27852 [Catharanthus roseus]